METTGGVEYDDISRATLGRFECVKGDGCRVGSVLAGYDVDIQTICPVFDLLVRRRAESITGPK